jgi:WD40 repeat protein
MEGMDSEAIIHPTADQLQRFSRGLLPPAEAAGLEEHLCVCDACCRLLEAMPGDSFLGRLREAQELSSPDTLAYSTDTTDLVIADIPGDLANHPRYRVLRLLGRGGMGAVYLAEHRRMDRLVALKVINPGLLNQGGALMRFQQEVKAAARLDHPNIVAAYDADQAGELHFLVMEYVEGRNLADVLAEAGPLPITQACDFVRQAALGLQHAHECSMVHRDIKPHNLMLTPAGQVKVLDFGMARIASESADEGTPPRTGEGTPRAGSVSDGTSGEGLRGIPSLTLTARGLSRLTGVGAVIGTADYIAPEQVRDAHLADGRSDIYSLGCTLYHLLTGRPPFPEGSAREKLLLHANESPPSMYVLRLEVPEGLGRVVAKMMAKKPEDRYPTAEEVAIALRAFVPGDNGIAGSRRRRRAIVAILFLVGFLCAAGAGWWIRSRESRGAENAGQTAAIEEGRPAEDVGLVRRWQQHDGGNVSCIALASDGRSAWSAAPRDICRWDLATGKTIDRIATPNWVKDLVLSPDGKRLVAAEGNGGALRIFDADTMKEVRTIPGHASYSQAVWFPDGSRVITGGYDHKAHIWDLKAGKIVRELKGFPSYISCVSVSQDGQRVLTGMEATGVVMVWDLRDEEHDFLFEHQVATANSACFTRDGRAILSGGRDGSVRLVDAQTGIQIKEFRAAPRDIRCMRITLLADGRHFLTGGSDGYLRLWDMESGRQLYKAELDKLPQVLAVTPDGRDLFIGTDDGEIIQWRLPALSHSEKSSARHGDQARVAENGKNESVFPRPTRVGDRIRLDGYRDAVWGAAFSPDGRYTLTTGRCNFLHDRSDYHIARRLGRGIWFAAFSPDSRQALVGDEFMRGPILRDVESGKVVRRYDDPPVRGRVLNGGFSPDGKYIAASAWDVVRVHDKETGKLVMMATTNPHCRPTFVFITGERLLVVAPDARSIDTYEVSTGKKVAPPLLSPKPIWALARSPDGKTILATQHAADDVLLWKIGNQHPVRRLIPTKREKRYTEDQVVFLPDSRRALTSRASGTITLWDVPTGRELQRWLGLGEIVGLAVSPDGRWALCGLVHEHQAILVPLPDPVTTEKVSMR